MMATSTGRFKRPLAWIGLVLAGLYGVLAWMAWRDISINLYEYNAPEAVTARDWTAVFVPAASSLFTLIVALSVFQTRRPWQKWAIGTVFVANLVVQVVLFVLFMSSW